MKNSKIEWTHHTVNLWWGCTEVNCGCKNCYARILAALNDFDIWGNDKPRVLIKSAFNKLIKFQLEAKKENKIHLVFMHSMSDLFENDKPMLSFHKNSISTTMSQTRMKLFKLIDDGWYPNLVFLFLTKRPSNINKMIPKHWLDFPPTNVWFGTSVSDQDTFNTAIRQMEKVCGNKFLSIEPQLAPIELHGCGAIKW